MNELNKDLKIIFLTPYPYDMAPGQRFRFEQYLSVLNGEEYSIDIYPFLTADAFNKLYQKGYSLKKTGAVISGFCKRFIQLFYVSQADYIFLYREAAPLGPPLFEWVISKVLGKRVIYDFDDAIWLTDKTNEGWIEKILRWRSKAGSICRWSYKVSCGNDYLASYARQFNKSVIVNPTTIDTDRVHNPESIRVVRVDKKKEGSLIIGWTGSHSTLKYLKAIESCLQYLENHFDHLRFLVIADRKPELSLKRFDFLPWNQETEASDLKLIDIGIMPLPDDDWARGKCGFKALQYMAMEIPCVVSPVGVNTSIVDHGINGFLARNEQDWIDFLSILISESALRKKLGTAGREKVVNHYSVLSNSATFLSLFQ